MSEQFYTHYRSLEAQMAADGELQTLRQRLAAQEPLLREAIGQLPPEQQQEIWEYLGILAELSQRVVEIVSFSQF